MSENRDLAGAERKGDGMNQEKEAEVERLLNEEKKRHQVMVKRLLNEEKKRHQVICPDCGAWLELSSSKKVLPVDLKVKFISHAV